MTARIRDALRRDSGAAAVEFALLVPIFVMLTFGAITAGIGFYQNISLTQGARDAARFGSTLPISTVTSTCPPASGTDADVNCWLSQVETVAVREAGWNPSSFAPGALGSYLAGNGDGYVCVAYVAPATLPDGSTQTTSNLTAGTARTGDPTSSGSPCFTDGRTDARVQVVVRRDAFFNAVFVFRNWQMRTTSAIPYERKVP